MNRRCRLSYDDFCPDRHLLEKFGGIFLTQADTAVGGGVAGEVTGMQAEISAGETQVEGHACAVEG